MAIDRTQGLPALESVTSDKWALAWLHGFVVLVVASLVSFIAVMLYALIYLPRGPWFAQPMVRLVAGITWTTLAALGAYAVLRSDYSWRTDRDGITISGIRRKRFVLWSEVLSAKLRKSSSIVTAFGLVCPRATIWIPMHLGPDVSVIASAWQHLRRLDKADDTMLPSAAKSLWTPVPEDTPLEMDWHNPHAPNWSLSFAVLVLLLLGILVFYFHDSIGKHVSSLFHYSCVAIGGAYGALRKRLMTASRCEIRADRFEARTFWGPINLAWSDLTHVDLSQDWLTVSGRGVRETAIIPYHTSDPESTRAVFSIIRNARAAGHLVAIPQALPLAKLLQQTADQSAPKPGDVVELTCSKAFTVLMVVAMLMIIAVAFQIVSIWVTSPLLLYGIIGFIAVADIAGIAHIARTLRVDDVGVTARTVFRTKTVYWHQVAVYSVKSVRQSDFLTAHILKSGANITLPTFRKLKDVSGGILMDLSSLPGSEEDKQRFIAIVDARLANVRRDEPA